jgi:hypothetical protein
MGPITEKNGTRPRSFPGALHPDPRVPGQGDRGSGTRRPADAHHSHSLAREGIILLEGRQLRGIEVVIEVDPGCG